MVTDTCPRGLDDQGHGVTMQGSNDDLLDHFGHFALFVNDLGEARGKGFNNAVCQEHAQKCTHQGRADQANFDKLEKELKQKLSENKKLENLKEQVSITREKDGLRIEIIDKADFAMFPSGQVSMQGRAQALINEVAASLADMPNKIAIRGHTDAVPFQNAEGRNNWSLSAERAEATRKMLEKNGIKESRFSKIEGVADTDPFNAKDPRDPRNRRMSITVQYQDP